MPNAPHQYLSVFDCKRRPQPVKGCECIGCGEARYNRSLPVLTDKRQNAHHLAWAAKEALEGPLPDLTILPKD